jgi:hypothetical protein
MIFSWPTHFLKWPWHSMGHEIYCVIGVIWAVWVLIEFMHSFMTHAREGHTILHFGQIERWILSYLIYLSFSPQFWDSVWWLMLIFYIFDVNHLSVSRRWIWHGSKWSLMCEDKRASHIQNTLCVSVQVLIKRFAPRVTMREVKEANCKTKMVRWNIYI